MIDTAAYSDYIGNVASITRELVSTDSTVSVDGSPLPDTGYWVGRFGIKLPEVKHSVWNSTFDFVARNIGHAVYFGSWQDSSGILYIDVVDLFLTRDAALAAGAERGEKAIWDIANAQEISCDYCTVHGHEFDYTGTDCVRTGCGHSTWKDEFYSDLGEFESAITARCACGSILTEHHSHR